MEPTGNPKLSIVIVNYDSWEDVTRQVDQWAHTSEFQSGRIELAVVDNNSPTLPPASRFQHQGLKWLDLKTNGGFAAGVNAGWKISNGQWLLLANPDLDVAGSLAGQVLALLDKIDANDMAQNSQKIGVIGISLTNPDGSWQPSVGTFPTALRSLLEFLLPRNRRRYQIVSPEKFSIVDWVTGAFFLVRHQTMQELGGFDTDYFLYFEETDFCFRARQAGWLTAMEPSLSVCHQKPLQNRIVSPIIRLWTRHSRLLFFKKNRPKIEFRLMLLLVRIEAELKNAIAILGIGRFPKEVWTAIRHLTFQFKHDRQPTGEQVREWAVEVLNQEND